MDQIGLTAAQIVENSEFFVLGICYLGGFLTAFTPCVYPLIPITIGVMGARTSSSIFQSFLLAVTFVLGLAVVYSSLGFAAASTGQLLGGISQQPWMIWTVSILFLVMGLGLLGVFEFRLPSSLNNWLATKGGGGFAGAFVLGAVSGILAAPCAGPVVVGILGYVASKANPFFGFTLLMTFAIGLGTPFLVLGTFSQLIRRLPKTGVWTEWIKHLFGFAFIFAFFVYIHPLLPTVLFYSLILTSGIFLVVYLPKVFPTMSGNTHPLHLFGRVVLIFGLLVFVVMNSRQWSIQPQAPSASKDLAFTWVRSEPEGLAMMKQEGKPGMIDFWASWCAACIELDNYTYSNAEVQKFLNENFISIKIDATKTTEEVERLSRKYKVFGLPTVLFLSPDGKVLTDQTVTGFVDAKRMLELLKMTSRHVQSR